MAGERKSPLQLNIEAAYDGLATDYTVPIHHRESNLEAIIMAARFTSTLTTRQNEMLVQAVKDDCFSTCLGLTLPASIFFGGTFSTHRTGKSGFDMYSTYLPKPTKEMLEKKTAGDIGTAGTATANAGQADEDDEDNNGEDDNDGNERIIPDDVATNRKEQDQRVKHTHDYANYVSGDPKNVNVPLQQASNLLHMFFALRTLKQGYHDKISRGEEGIDFIIRKYKELTQEVMKCTGVGDDTWSEILRRYDGQSDGGMPPWNPFFVEELMDEHSPKRVVSYRFLIFMNRHMGQDIQAAFNEYVDELRERLAYNSECISKIKEVCGHLNKTPQPGRPQPVGGVRGGGGGGGGANMAAAAAAPQIDELSIHQKKMAALTERVKSDYLEVAKLLIGTQIRSWEIPLIELIKDPYHSYFNGSTVLTRAMCTLLVAGDNIAMPRCQQANAEDQPDDNNNNNNNIGEVAAAPDSSGVYSVGYDKVDTSKRFVNPFARNSAQRASVIANTTTITTRLTQPPTAAAALFAEKTTYTRPTIDELNARVARNTYLISQQKEFDQCWYLPAATMQKYETSRVGNPIFLRDPRHIENIFNILGTFSSFVCTSINPRQLTPAVYFDLNDGGGERSKALREKTPPYVITTPSVPHYRDWHGICEANPSITYGGLVNRLPEAYGNFPFHDTYRHFKGFPKEVVERGHVTIIWPTCQPWEFGMIPLPEIMRSVKHFEYTQTLTRRMAVSGNGGYTQFLESIKKDDPLSIACLYMAAVMSVETLHIDSAKTPHPIGLLPIITEVGHIQRLDDLNNDKITIPESCQTLGSIFNEANKFLNRRIQAARMNITCNHQVPTRIAFETGQPVVRQPTDPIDGGEQNQSLAVDRENFILGMDVYHYGGDASAKYFGFIEMMCGNAIVTETSVVPLGPKVTQYGINLAQMKDEKRRPRRTDTNKLLIADIEELALRLLTYTKNVPDLGIAKVLKPLNFTRLVSRRMPVLHLPMPIPISNIFEEFNKRATSEKWGSFNVNIYTNTAPIDEMIAYMATLGVCSYKIYSGVDTFLICDVCMSSATRYNVSLNSPHLHLLLVGETATSKSYIYKIMRKLATPGTVLGTSEGSSKSNMTHTNYNGQADILDEAHDFLTINPDKAAGRNPKQTAQIEAWKNYADAGLIDYTYLDTSDPSGNPSSGANKVMFRRKGLAISLCNGVIMYSMNKGVDAMQNAVRERMLIINPPINNDNGKALTGSQLSDYALHNIDAFKNLKPGAMRSRHSWITLMHLYARLNPRFSPDIYDVANLIGEVLREAKQHLPRNIHETRMYGRFWAFLTELTYMRAHHMVTRDNMDDNAKYAPSEHGSGSLALRHLSVEDYMSQANKYLYATKGDAIVTLTLLKDILESPIRTAILEFLAEKCYPDGNVNYTTFRRIDPNGGSKKKKGGGQGNHDPDEELPIQTDFNTIVWSSTYTDLDTLFTELGKKIGHHVSYSAEQVRYVFYLMKAESFETLPNADLNRKKFPMRVKGFNVVTAMAAATASAAKRTAAAAKRAANNVKRGKKGAAPPPPPAPTPAATSKNDKQDARILKKNPELAAAIGAFAPQAVNAMMTSDDRSNDASMADAVMMMETAANRDPKGERAQTALERARALEQDERWTKWGSKELCPPSDAPFSRSVLSLEKTAIVGGSVSNFYHIHVPHRLLRNYYRPKLPNGSSPVVDPFDRSHVWKAFAATLQNKALERYPKFITDAIAANLDKKFSTNGQAYFKDGPYHYMTGRTDATNSRAEKYIKAAQKEIDAEYARIGTPKGPGRRQLPHIMPTRWPAESPALVRNESKACLKLPCIIDDSDIDKTCIYGPSVNFGSPKSTELLEYDIDYISMLRRYVRLGIDVKANWENLPIVCKIKKSMDGPMYPKTSYEMSIDGMKTSILSDIKATGKIRANRLNGGWGEAPVDSDDEKTDHDNDGDDDDDDDDDDGNGSGGNSDPPEPDDDIDMGLLLNEPIAMTTTTTITAAPTTTTTTTTSNPSAPSPPSSIPFGMKPGGGKHDDAGKPMLATGLAVQGVASPSSSSSLQLLPGRRLQLPMDEEFDRSTEPTASKRQKRKELTASEDFVMTT